MPLLALVHNRTRQNDGRISLQKQTSNDKRQSNLTKLGINLLFVSENVCFCTILSNFNAGLLLNSFVTQSTYGVILCLPCVTLKIFLTDITLCIQYLGILLVSSEDSLYPLPFHSYACPVKVSMR